MKRDIMAAQICGGLNAIEKTEAKREPFLEAFSFSSIQKNMLQGGDFNIYEEFINVVKELYLVNLGIDDNENLLRAQGATFMLMRNMKTLEKMLKADYENQKRVFTFCSNRKLIAVGNFKKIPKTKLLLLKYVFFIYIY